MDFWNTFLSWPCYISLSEEQRNIYLIRSWDSYLLSKEIATLQIINPPGITWIQLLIIVYSPTIFLLFLWFFFFKLEENIWNQSNFLSLQILPNKLFFSGLINSCSYLHLSLPLRDLYYMVLSTETLESEGWCSNSCSSSYMTLIMLLILFASVLLSVKWG